MFKLNIYKEHSPKEIEKTYETEEIHVMYGTLEDIAAVVNCDITEKNNAITIGKTVVQAMPVFTVDYVRRIDARGTAAHKARRGNQPHH